MDKPRYLKGHTLLFSIIAVLLYLVSCEDKSFDNPYDQNVDIDSLAPYDLEVEHISILKKKIKWKCDVESPVQFLIDKRVDDGEWFEVFKSKLEYPFEWTDSAIELNKTQHYRIKAKFDERISSEANLSINGDIPEPLDLKVEKINDIRNKVNWGYDLSGIHGFRIDRRIKDEEWKINYGELAANQTAFIDTNVLFNPDKNTILEYRIYAFYENHESTKVLATSNVELPAPANPEIIENSLTSVTILWQDISDGEDGFRVERKYDGGSWHEIAVTQNSSFVDSDFELNTGVYYRLSSYYSEHSSNFVTIDFDARVPAPENFEITKTSLSSVTLNWNYNHSGHDSFKIDRRVDNGSWETEYQILNVAITSMTDEVDLKNHDYSYRVITGLDDYQSLAVEQTVKGLNLDMVTVNGGTFEMGSNDGNSDEQPIHTVTLSSFEISKYEITNVQFAEFLNDIGCNSDGSYNDDEYGNVEYIDIDNRYCQVEYNGGQFEAEISKDNYPLVEVSWYGANAFVQWAGGRLPTEAEWEFAARGGNQSQGFEYSGSDNLDEVGWYDGNSGGNTHEVGQKQPNELGIYDMSGNVREWCHDWYLSDYYSNSPENNPQGPSSSSNRVSRGGAWFNDDVNRCRVANRLRLPPSAIDQVTGFRIVR